MQDYLRLDSITKTYGDKTAVSNLSLSVPKGSIYGVIGPNGAGKTTTIRMIMDIIAPDSGRIMIEGKEAGPGFKNRVGYLPEERGLYKKHTVEEIVFLLGEIKNCPHKVLDERMDQWLDRMNLLDYRKKKVEELSKGMAQKLQFITTVIHNPDIIILDELFSGLDPINIELIKNILLEEKRNGKTILFSTHVMEQAEKLCDFLCMINNGEKVLDGKLSDVKGKFGQNRVQINIDGDGAFIKDLPGVESMNEFNNYIEIKLGDSANPQEILKTISERVMVRRFEMMEPSLYNIFIEVAGVKPKDVEEIKGVANA